jgi:hypothetical protein
MKGIAESEGERRLGMARRRTGWKAGMKRSKRNRHQAGGWRYRPL